MSLLTDTAPRGAKPRKIPLVEAREKSSVFDRAGEATRRSIMVPLRVRTEPQASRRALCEVALFGA
jgi:hypothetical protein